MPHRVHIGPNASTNCSPSSASSPGAHGGRIPSRVASPGVILCLVCRGLPSVNPETKGPLSWDVEVDEELLSL